MSRLSVARGKLALWRRREKYRLGRYRWFRDRSKRKNRVELRRKWWRLLDQSRDRIDFWEARVKQLDVPSPRQQAVQWALAQVGTKERPAGSNGGPKISGWQEAFGFGRVPWCGIFVGQALLHAAVKGVTSRIASVSLIEQDAKAHRGPFRGWTTDHAVVLPGDLVVLFGQGVHVEMVVRTFDDGSVETVGGNTSEGDGSQDNGGQVAHRSGTTRRKASDVRGFALVRYGK